MERIAVPDEIRAKIEEGKLNPNAATSTDLPEGEGPSQLDIFWIKQEDESTLTVIKAGTDMWAAAGQIDPKEAREDFLA